VAGACTDVVTYGVFGMLDAADITTIAPPLAGIAVPRTPLPNNVASKIVYVWYSMIDKML
jgi:hypothetical protein